MSTHIAAAPGQIAPQVLLPGDPLRAEWIARTFLEDATPYTTVRNMLGFTGTYQGLPVSVQGSGMGMPSLSIYACELMTEYDVQTIVRVGTCGGISAKVKVRDVLIAQGASTDSAINRLRFEGLDYAPVADFGLLRAAVDVAAERGYPAVVGGIFSSDSFYNDRAELVRRMAGYGVLGIEMEASALYTLAAKHGRRALAVCTVSDHLLTGEETTAQEREQTFGDAVRIALGAIVATTPG